MPTFRVRRESPVVADRAADNKVAMEEIKPDLSHLTPEEIEVIESVLRRQKEEEAQERLIMEKKREEMKALEEQIRERSEQQKKAGIELDSTCHICLKTKFADGFGHICHYCNIRCCARCGGKVTLRSNKVIWVCILCRKKQELLSKTGQWINQRMTSSDTGQRLLEMAERQTGVDNKRDKLERTQSAAEKENTPFERSGIRRQLSHQEQSRLSAESRTEKGSSAILRQNLDDPDIRLPFGKEPVESSRHYIRRSEIPSGYTSDSYAHSFDRFEKPCQRTGSSNVIYPQPPPSNGKRRRNSVRSESGIRTQALIVKEQLLQQQKSSYSSSEEDLKSYCGAASEDRDVDKSSFDKRDKPSVTVTSPSSPDVNVLRALRRYARTANNYSIGGRIQVKLWFDSSTLRLVVTLVCAMGLIPRTSGQNRNPYAKLYLLPDRSEKSKRRTKTLANTNEPKWNQSFVYSSVRRADLKVKMIEISVWDYVQFGTNDFLGEARIELAIAPLNDEAEWIHLSPHEELVMPRNEYGSCIQSDHLSPPSTTSRLSDSDTSDIDDTNRRVADGASISSLGSSASPPPDYEITEKRRSRKDMISPQEHRKMPYFGPLNKHQSLERDNKIMYETREYHQRSRSVAPVGFPLMRSRSKSPQRIYDEPMHPISGTGRTQSSIDIYPGTPIYSRHPGDTRSATSTPISSPKRRQLPKIPASVSPALRERIAQDLEVRGFFIKNRSRLPQQSSAGNSAAQGSVRHTGWNRHHTGGSYGSLGNGHQNRSLSPPSARAVFGEHKKEGDGEDSYSIDSSTFSTQSDRPQGTRYEDEYDHDIRRGSTQQSSSTLVSGEPLERSYSQSDVPSDKIIDVSERSSTPRVSSRISEKAPHWTSVGRSSNESSMSDLTVCAVQRDIEQQKNSPSTSERGGTKSGTRGTAELYGLPKKSNSTSQLSATDGYRTGGADTTRRKRSTPGNVATSVHRSEEINPKLFTTDSTNNICSSASPTASATLKIAETEQFEDFIGSLGPAQLVGRQVLGSPSLGEVQLSLSLRKGRLEVEVIRARGLQTKPTYKNLPTPYVKLYLVKGKKCLEKHKAKSPRETLDPLYQTTVHFKENYEGCILQVTVWGDYGRFDLKKVFMGVAQIALYDLDLNTLTIGWYKLFGTSSL